MIYPIEDPHDRSITVFRFRVNDYSVMLNNKVQASYRTFKEAVEHARRLATEPPFEPENGAEE